MSFEWRRLHLSNMFRSLPKNRRTDVIIISSLLREHKDYRNSTIEKQESIEFIIESSCFENRGLHNINISLVKNILFREESRNIVVPKLLNGDILPENLYKTSISDFTNSHNNIIEELKVRLSKQIVYKTSSFYKCPKCRLKNAKIREEQRRGLDEGSTIIATCLTDGCGHEWLP